jgi:hypothetical protein
MEDDMSRSWRNNNPGNIRHFGPGSFAERTGATGKDNSGFAIYPTAVQGMAAMFRLMGGSGYRNLTILEAIKRYAPDSDNNYPIQYCGFVCAEAGIGPDQTIAELDPYQFIDMVLAMIKFEGWEKE